MCQWLETAPGAYALDWMQHRCDQALVDVFGYHALQLGLPELQGLRANRMPGRWLAGLAGQGQSKQTAGTALLCDGTALPFESASLDLVVLPLTLDLSVDPHETLREVERVLVPEGRVLVLGLNPASLWGLRQKRAHVYRRMGLGQLYLPGEGQFIAHWRLRDWLRLLSFEVESSEFGCYRPAMRSPQWLQRYAWMDALGHRSWPIFGAVYSVMAVKRVKGMRLIGPAWKSQRAVGKSAVPAINRMGCSRPTHES